MLGSNDEKLLARLTLARVYSAEHLQMIVTQLVQQIHNYQLGLIVIDDVRAHFQQDTQSEEPFVDKSFRRLLLDLSRLSRMYSIPIVVTSRGYEDPQVFFGDALKSDVDMITCHTIRLRRSHSNAIIAGLVGSPSRPRAETIFKIEQNGIISITTSQNGET